MAMQRGKIMNPYSFLSQPFLRAVGDTIASPSEAFPIMGARAPWAVVIDDCSKGRASDRECVCW